MGARTRIVIELVSIASTTTITVPLLVFLQVLLDTGLDVALYTTMLSVFL